MRVRVGPINSLNLIWGPQIIEADFVEVAILGGLNDFGVDLQRKKSAHSVIEKSGPFLLLRRRGTPSFLEVGPHLCGHRRIGRGGGGRCPHWYRYLGGNPGKGQTVSPPDSRKDPLLPKPSYLG
jgi:hypothetical protein